LVEQLRGFSITAIGIEASGGCERGAVRSLQAAGMPVRQVNPFKLRQFAKASGVLAKNDPLDARMIASFVGIMPDASSAADDAGSGAARRDARCSPPAQR
jgi:transposase